MRKVLLSLGLMIACTTSMRAESHVMINTSCGVIVDMVYEDGQAMADVIHDALILEEYFCG